MNRNWGGVPWLGTTRDACQGIYVYNIGLLMRVDRNEICHGRVIILM